MVAVPHLDGELAGHFYFGLVAREHRAFALDDHDPLAFHPHEPKNETPIKVAFASQRIVMHVGALIIFWQDPPLNPPN